MLKKSLVLMTAGVCASTPAYALGIRIFDHDAFATARGDAFAATADNPSAIYYNPAGISQLSGHNARVTFNGTLVDSDFNGRFVGNSSIDESWSLAPSVFYTYKATNCPVSIGLGYYIPFGLSLEWPKNGPFRDITTHGSLQYHTINPVIGYQVTKTLSLATGPMINYANIDLRSGVPGANLPFGDQHRFTGDDWNLGYNVGLHWKPLDQHAFGITYRSNAKMEFSGKSKVTPYPVPTVGASTSLPFPEVLVLGYSYRPTPQWNLEVNLDWTGWDRVNTPVLKKATGNQPLPLRWESSYAIEVGATRYFENGLHVSAGYVWLENSVPNSSFNPVVPDQDLHVFSAGVGGTVDWWNWDLTYQFSYGPGRDVKNSLYGPGVAGEYGFTAHNISLSAGFNF